MARPISHTFILCLYLFHCTVAWGDNTLLIELGKDLFSNTNLSKNRNVACATCHNPENAFTDPRKNAAEGAISSGTIKNSFGRRNTTTLTYTLLTPPLISDSTGPIGGLFFDGRVNNFEDQILHPLFDENEMGLSNELMLFNRLKGDSKVKDKITQIFGQEALENPDVLLNAVQTSIAAFERSKAFSAFDSKYDRFLAGSYTMSKQEERGFNIFFSDVSNCMNCHLLNKGTLSKEEPFTDLRYHNIGVPRNQVLAREELRGPSYNDRGLEENPSFSNSENSGKFKTPTLRNVAVTSPYMHNGIFQELRTTLLFYNFHLIKNEFALTNPETQEYWGNPESSDNINDALLTLGQPLDSSKVDSLIAFLKILTDKRYEHLLETK